MPIKINLGEKLFIHEKEKILNHVFVKIKQKMTIAVTKTLY